MTTTNPDCEVNKVSANAYDLTHGSQLDLAVARASGINADLLAGVCMRAFTGEIFLPRKNIAHAMEALAMMRGKGWLWSIEAIDCEGHEVTIWKIGRYGDRRRFIDESLTECICSAIANAGRLM
jgi:hypothetical protein